MRLFSVKAVKVTFYGDNVSTVRLFIAAPTYKEKTNKASGLFHLQPRHHLFLFFIQPSSHLIYFLGCAV